MNRTVQNRHKPYLGLHGEAVTISSRAALLQIQTNSSNTKQVKGDIHILDKLQLKEWTHKFFQNIDQVRLIQYP